MMQMAINILVVLNIQKCIRVMEFLLMEYQLNKPIMTNLKTLFQQLLHDEWSFLDVEWPMQEQSNNHRTALKQVAHMKIVKNVLMRKLGAVPVFYFLVVIWSRNQYPGPYREVDKGLLILYHLVAGLAMDGMSTHIPKSSFHSIHTEFYKSNYNVHSKHINQALANMFSTFPIRLISAKLKNPPLFPHVTLHLDGHDTRLSCEEKSSSEMYSYKLKKSGVRTQVCVDCNGMTILVSKSLPCKDNNDGTMLVGMKIHKHIHELDCIALDGGYTQYIKKIVDDTSMSKKNFCYPIRKSRGKDLAQDEANYNKIFGSFRSQMEAEFGDLGAIFEKHNNRKPVLVTKIETYNLQLRLCLLLMNIKKMVALLQLDVEPIHSAWIRDGFDFPYANGALEQILDYIPVEEMLHDARDITKLQEKFLEMTTMDVEDKQREVLTNKRREIFAGVEIPSFKRTK
jgi:DDE superfamily endonuclease